MRKIQSLLLYAALLLCTYSSYGQKTYSGLFVKGAAESTFETNMNWQGFTTKHATYQSKGYQLKDVEILKDGNEHRFWGVWVKDDRNTFVQEATGWAAFIQLKRKMAGEKYTLIDVEAYVDANQKDRFVGVWQSNPTPHKVWLLDTWEGLEKKVQQSVSFYLYLRDVEVITMANKETKYLAIFHLGDREYQERGYLFSATDAKSFQTDRRQREKSGYKMIDTESVKGKEQIQYIGVYQKLPYSYALRIHMAEPDFSTEQKELKSKKLSLVDLEVIHEKSVSLAKKD